VLGAVRTVVSIDIDMAECTIILLLRNSKIKIMIKNFLDLSFHDTSFDSLHMLVLNYSTTDSKR